jgi:polyferredoxin
MLAIWLVASLTLGRGWCAWVCFYGGWDDLFSRARKRALISLEGKEASVRRFSYAMLAFVALASLASLSAVYCVWLCPFKLVTEYPAITGFTGYLATMIFILAFFGLVVVMPALTRKRFQCAAYCPFGALQGLIDGISPFRIRIDTAACIGCGACARVCPVLAIDKALIEAKKAVPHLNCVKCGECVAACPRGAIRLAFRIASAPLVAPAAAITAKADKAPSTSARERRMGAMLAEIVQPRILFATTAFVFGMVISSSFAVRSVGMVIVAVAGLFTGGR